MQNIKINYECELKASFKKTVRNNKIHCFYIQTSTIFVF